MHEISTNTDLPPPLYVFRLKCSFGISRFAETKDILHVMKVLGHANIRNTLVYTQLMPEEDDEYVVKVARTVDDAKTLLKCGFDYVTDVDRAKLLRKRK